MSQQGYFDRYGSIHIDGWPPYPSGSILDGETRWSPRYMNEYKISASSALYVEPNPIMTVSDATNSLDVSDDLVNRLWEKLYNKKPIVFCVYCNSGNVFDNPACVQCGAPMGDSAR